MAVLSDHRQLCVTLCLMGADPNARNKQKLTPLFYAKSRRVLKALLHHGCNPLLVNKSGETALDYLTRLKGPDDWDFGMRELLQEAMDARMRGIHHEKEARRRLDVAQREAEDDLSSLNSSLASLLPAPFRSTAARARKEGSSNALEQLSKSVDSSPFGKKARRR
jgi:ankyrin repeat protein